MDSRNHHSSDSDSDAFHADHDNSYSGHDHDKDDFDEHDHVEDNYNSHQNDEVDFGDHDHDDDYEELIFDVIDYFSDDTITEHHQLTSDEIDVLEFILFKEADSKQRSRLKIELDLVKRIARYAKRFGLDPENVDRVSRKIVKKIMEVWEAMSH